MVSTEVMLQERAPASTSTPFAIAELAPPPQLPAVIAATEKALRTTDQVVLSTAAKAPGAVITGLGFLTGIAVPMLAPVVLIATFVPGSIPNLGDTGGPALLAASIAATGLSIGLQRASMSRANASLHAQLDADVAKLEQEAGGAGGLKRAWIAQRARGLLEKLAGNKLGDKKDWLSRVLDRLWPSLEQHSFIGRIKQLANLSEGCSPEERGQAAKAEALYRCAFPFANKDSYRSSEPGVEFINELEKHQAEIEALTPDTRELLRSCILEPVVAVLDRDPGNRWRRKRFVEAFDGKRTPYTNEVSDLAMPVFNLEIALKGERSPRGVHANVAEGIQYLTNRLKRWPCKDVCMSSAEGAEQVAAHFERLNFRAALYARREGEIIVTVYDPARPPSGYSVQRPYADDRD